MIEVAGASSATHRDTTHFLSSNEVNSLNESIELIRFVWSFQSRLKNIQEAYIELELDMAEFCVRFGTTPYSSISFLNIRPRLDRRLLNLLSAIRAYHDHNKQELKKRDSMSEETPSS